MDKEKKHRIDFGDEQSHDSTRGLVMDILNGSIFNRSGFTQHTGYFFFLFLLAILYIGNRYHAESVLKNIKKADKELFDIRSEAVSVSSELMILKNQSSIKILLDTKNSQLKPLTEPPKKIYVDD